MAGPVMAGPVMAGPASSVSSSVAVAIALVALGILAWPAPRMFAATAPGRPRQRPGLNATQRRAVLVGVAALALTLVGDWWPWWLAGTVAAVAAIATLRVPVRASGAHLQADRRVLAVHADLLAACTDAGMPIGAALSAVNSTRRPAVDRRAHDPPDPLAPLDEVAALLMLGAEPTKAWATVGHSGELASLAAAASRSSAGGTTLADAVREHALTLRAAMAADAERSAGRAGVAMTAPLGLCFLPAFFCLGLAPVVVGLLSTLHLF